MHLICHVTLQENIIQGSSDFMKRNSSLYVTTLPNCGSGNIIHLIFLLSLQDHLIRGSCDSIEGNSSLYVTILPNLVVAVIVIAEI